MHLDRTSIEAEQARRDFKLFVKLAWPEIEPGTRLSWNWHIDALAIHLQALYERQITRLLINIAPGHAKSSLVSVLFPVWCWINEPRDRWLCASHSLDLAIRDNRNRRRLIESEWFQSRYGHVFKMTGDQHTKCLLGSTKISTEHGELTIEDIVEQKMPVRVLTFNHVKSIIENKHILAYEKHAGRPCVQVICANGARITCTINHPFYVFGRGYVEAEFLQARDVVYARKADVRGVREGISSTLPESSDGQVFAACVQQGMSEVVDTRGGTSSSYLPAMWEVQPVLQGRDQNTCQKVLQPCLPCEVVQSASRQSYRTDMSDMRETVSGLSGSSAPEVLLSCLLSRESPLDNTWNGTPALRERFWDDIASDTQARRQPVYALPEYSTAGSSPYRSRQTEQFRNEFDNVVPSLPSAGNPLTRELGGVEATTVIAIIPDVSPSVVYNLEIENNHNYFANGILTHNSFFENDAKGYQMAVAVRSSGTGKRGTWLLIDDPHNAMEGEAHRKQVIEWFGKTWMSRLNDQERGPMVVVGQRLHEEDLSGHILKLGGWQHLNLPEEYDPSRRCVTSIGWQDPRSEPGELLWPKRFPREILDKLKFELGSVDYAAQFQQLPMPAGGGQFRKQWFRYFSETDEAYLLETPEGVRSILKSQCWQFVTVDLAITSKQTSDYTVFAVWSVTPTSDLILIDLIRVRIGNPEQLQQLRMLHHRFLGAYFKIERVGYQLALIQQALNEGIPCREYVPVKDKVSRASTPSIWMENGKMYFRKQAHYLPDLETELLLFPRGAHDDIVDCCSMAADEVATPRGPLVWSVDSPQFVEEEKPETAEKHSLLEINWNPPVPAAWDFSEGEMIDVEIGGRWS